MGVVEDPTERLVRETLSAVASQVRSSNDESEDDPASQLRATSSRTATALRRPRRRRRLVAIAACLVVLLVAGGVVAVTQGADNAPKVSVSPADTPPSGSDVELPYAVPADTAEITSMGVNRPPSGQDLPTLFQQFYSGTIDGTSLTLEVMVQVFPESLADQSFGQCNFMPSLSVNGHEGCSIAVQTGAVLTQGVYWREDTSTLIGLKASGLSVDQLLALANSVKRSPDGSRIALEPVPDGLQPSGTNSEPKANDQGSASVQFTHDGCDYALTRRVAPTTPTTVAPVQTVTINGYPGAVIGENMIAWGVRGSMITLGLAYYYNVETGQQAVPAASCDVQATAATISYISEDAWNQLLADYNADTSATTSTPPTTTSSPASDPSQPEYQGDEAQIADVFRTFISGPDIDTRVSLIEDGESLRETLSKNPPVTTGTPSARVDSVSLVDDTHASVTYSVLLDGQLALPNQQGAAVKIDGKWRMSRASYCALVAKGGLHCPPA